MTKIPVSTDHDWQLQHYADVGKDYGSKHFTQADNDFTTWILSRIAAIHPSAQRIAEIGAGTCIFASLLGKKLSASEPVVCYEPVASLLEAALEHDNIDATCSSAIEFAQYAPNGHFDLIYTKDTAHHFASETLTEIHQGICDSLAPGGRYAMVVRTPPDHDCVPVGRLAANKWHSLYTSADELLRSMREVSHWREVEITRWQKYVSTPVSEWLDGIRDRDTWSVFSALDADEITRTVDELTEQFDGDQWFPFLHQYDVAIFEKA
ncbi:class I SAM-dependent methyltransferase [Stieleria varia]|uniref:Uncharacterized protein n=1 Tax=Stieleria varia TaxID=2528005 RepID=A0A5C6A8R5_9BACT|nr:class I SAM-dependent methyltransferase [Stieleria varia]TWT94673.1 hypothetical protein Pla52n_54940 [Stieleria varia]